MAYALKQAEPSCRVIFLGRTYTQGLINQCVDIDNFLDWEDIKKLNISDQISFLKKQNIDIFIHIYPQKDIAKLAKQAGIPIRIGTSHRIFHWLYCNKLVSIKRKNSALHETQLDLQLLKPLGLKFAYTLAEIIPMRRFKEQFNISPEIKNKIQNLLNPKKFNLVLHPLTRGRHIEWPLQHYQELIKYLDPEKFNIFITGSEQEGQEIRPALIQPFLNSQNSQNSQKNKNIIDLTGKFDLNTLIYFLSQIDGLICSSTGPVHLAAAFNKRTLGLYAPIKPFHAGRWGPVGAKAQVLSLHKDCSDCRDLSRCRCVGLIEVSQVLKIVRDWANYK